MQYFRSLSTVSTVFLSLLVLPIPAHPVQKSDFATNVVYLYGKSPKKENVKGADVEVWIKDPLSKKLSPLEIENYSGTGFIVMRDQGYFIVTAQHVALSVEDSSMVIFYGPNGAPIAIPLEALAATKPVAWYHHPEADVSVIRIAFPKDLPATVTSLALSFVETSDSAPSMDVLLTVVGFPLSLGASGSFSPIFKEGHAASGIFRLKRADMNTESMFFILDDPYASGFSGAPVYRLPTVTTGVMAVSQGDLKCFGLVHGTVSDKTGGKFSAIVPGRYIHEAVMAAP